jgi:hypothetical protein
LRSSNDSTDPTHEPRPCCLPPAPSGEGPGRGPARPPSTDPTMTKGQPLGMDHLARRDDRRGAGPRLPARHQAPATATSTSAITRGCSGST